MAQTQKDPADELARRLTGKTDTAPSDNAVAIPHKGMMKDFTDMFVPEGIWTHALNAVKATLLGKKGGVSNEQSNAKITETIFKIIQVIPLYGDKYAVFSTNDADFHEIGVFSEYTNSYTRVVRSACFAFNSKYTLTATYRRRLNNIYLYWQHLPGPDRYINLTEPPFKEIDQWIDNCKHISKSNEIDCNKTLLSSVVWTPKLTVLKGNMGQLPNGTYQAVMAYSIDGIRETDYLGVSLPAAIWSSSATSSIEVHLYELDLSYDEFELVIISKINNNTVAKKIGFYSTTNNVIVLDTILESAKTVPLPFIFRQTMKYIASDRMSSLNGYLIRSGVRINTDPNYQLLANQIETRWVEVDYDARYYGNGGKNVGYLRDEVYSYFIRWVYNTGDKTASYHIPGRASKTTDMSTVSTNTSGGKNKAWENRDTSSIHGDLTSGDFVFLDPDDPLGGGDLNASPLDDITSDGGTIVREGKMQYWESSEKYPNNKFEIWGSLCGKPIRHHKFPSNSKSPHFKKVGDVEKISVLGVRFLNISHPVDLDGKPIHTIVAYEILRGSRDGNKSIVAKGIFNSTLNYYNPDEGQNGIIQNFPYNSLKPNKFLRKRLYEQNYMDRTSMALDQYNHNRLSFHSPDTTFQRPFLSGISVRKYMDISGKTLGIFKPSYKQPKQKLMSAKSLKTLSFLTLSLAVAASIGKQDSGVNLSANALVVKYESIYSREDGPITSALSSVIAGVKLLPSGAIALIAFAANYSLWSKLGFKDAYDIMFNMIEKREYAFQFDSSCRYDKAFAGLSKFENFDINTHETKYITSGIQSINSDLTINNLFRNEFVHVGLNKNMSVPEVEDVSGRSLSDFDTGVLELTKGLISDTSSCSYGALRVDYQNQYGQLDSVKQVLAHSGVFNSTKRHSLKRSSPIVFGGDTYISLYSEKNPYLFFNSWQVGDADLTQFDYRRYLNGPIPRYWADFTKIDPSDTDLEIGETLFNWGVDMDDNSKVRGGYPVKFHLEKSLAQDLLDQGDSWNSASTVFSGTNSSDEDKAKRIAFAMSQYAAMQPKNTATVTGIFYISVNGIREFYVESEMNLNYREKGEPKAERFWGDKSSLRYDDFFRSDLITNGNFYKYDTSLRKNSFYTALASVGFVLSRDYDPFTNERDHSHYPLRSIYSLQQSSDQKRDNWRIYLPNNYKDFDSALTAIKPLNKTGAIMLFEESEPKEIVGVDTLQTDGGTKIIVGDGGLFSQAERSLANADDYQSYGSCSNFYSSVNTPFGFFYVSEKNGKLMHYAGELTELRGGMTRFIAKYIPLNIRKDFPDFNNYDNIVAGAGWTTVYDQQYELVYFIKRDFKLKPGKKIYYDASLRVFRPVVEDLDDSGGLGLTDMSPGDILNADMGVGGISGNPLRGMQNDNTGLLAGSTSYETIELGDPEYFEDASMTISYDPVEKTFVSFHRWMPDLVFGGKSHFFTIKDNGIWKHNDRFDSFCNFYGKDYEFEIEVPEVTGDATTTLSSVEYKLENFKYDQSLDSISFLDFNFDRAMIYNSYQNTGWLKLVLKPKNNMFESLKYPKTIPGLYTEILYTNEEHKLRFNQFADISNDQGEFSQSPIAMFNTAFNGWRRELNTEYINPNKNPFQRKKIRSTENRILLRRTVSGPVNMVFRFIKNKKVLSAR